MAALANALQGARGAKAAEMAGARSDLQVQGPRLRRYGEAQHDSEWCSLCEQIALIQTRVCELLSHLDDNANADRIWSQISQ